MKKPSKKSFGLFLLIFILLLQILPYAIPLQKAENKNSSPYPEAEFLEVQGIHLHYRVKAPKTLPAGKILLIHGLFEGTHIWDKTIETLLAQDYLVVLVDLPGFGYSTRKTGLKHDQIHRSQLLWKLLTAVDEGIELDYGQKIGRNPWILVGHSMGGACAGAMSSTNPKRVEKLVLVNAALFDNSPQWLKPLLNYPPLRRWVAVAADYVVLKPKFIRNFLHKAYGEVPLEEQWRPYMKALSVPGTGLAFADIVATSENIDPKKIPKNAFPIVGIWGEKDTWTSAEKTKESLPQMETFILKEAYHDPTETHPEAFNLLLIEALQK